MKKNFNVDLVFLTTFVPYITSLFTKIIKQAQIYFKKKKKKQSYQDIVYKSILL